MFTLNDDLSIYVTRGDIVFFTVSADDNGKPYKFQAGDVVRFKVYGKKNAENVVLQKDFPVMDITEEVEIFLSEADTRIGGVISKPADYWYEVELNPFDNPRTIIGYDEDGAKVFKLFPEGNVVPEFVPEPEDIPVVDEELDMVSTRPVQNQAVARAVVRLRADYEKTDAKTAETANKLAVERARIDNIVSGATTSGSEVADIRVGADGVTYESAGTAVRSQIDLASTFNTVKPFLFEGRYISSGTLLPSDNWWTTIPICVKQGDVVYVDGVCPYYQFYDNNLNYVEGSFTKVFEVAGNSIPRKYTILVENDGFVQFSFYGASTHAAYQNPETFIVHVGRVPRTIKTESISALHLAHGSIDKKHFGAKLVCKFTETEYRRNLVIRKENGMHIEAEDSVYNVSGYIPVCGGDSYWVNFEYPEVGWFYDENKVPICHIDGSVMGIFDVNSIKRKVVFTAPLTARYMRINCREDHLESQCVGYGSSVLSDEEIMNASGKVRLDYLEVPNTLKHWTGKTFVSLGDSITEQDGKAYTQGSNIGSIARGYQTILKELCGFNAYYNYGMGGRPIANGTRNGAGTVTTAQSVDYESADLCIIAGGTNDFRLDVPLGMIGVIGDTKFDDTTFYGAYRKMIEHILAEKPTIRICLFTPLQRDNAGYDVNYTNPAGHKLIDYVNAIRKLGEMYAIPVCDMYANSGITKLTFGTYTMDGLHPNDAGYDRIGGYASQFINGIGC